MQKRTDPGIFLATLIVAMGTVSTATVKGQDAAPPGANLAEFAARRFPQPVRVGDLIGRTVLQPLQSRPVLGHVSGVVRAADGSLKLIVDYGGYFGLHSRPIAVPIEGVVLLGTELEILDFKPAQLNNFPTYAGDGATALAPDDSIRVGLAHPSH